MSTPTNGDAPEIPTPHPITMLLTYDPATGNFNLQGPLENRILAYGMLALATEALQRMATGDRNLKGGGLVLPRKGLFR